MQITTYIYITIAAVAKKNRKDSISYIDNVFIFKC